MPVPLRSELFLVERDAYGRVLGWGESPAAYERALATMSDGELLAELEAPTESERFWGATMMASRVVARSPALATRVARALLAAIAAPRALDAPRDAQPLSTREPAEAAYRTLVATMPAQTRAAMLDEDCARALRAGDEPMLRVVLGVASPMDTVGEVEATARKHSALYASAVADPSYPEAGRALALAALQSACDGPAHLGARWYQEALARVADGPRLSVRLVEALARAEPSFAGAAASLALAADLALATDRATVDALFDRVARSREHAWGARWLALVCNGADGASALAASLFFDPREDPRLRAHAGALVQLRSTERFRNPAAARRVREAVCAPALFEALDALARDACEVSLRAAARSLLGS